MADIPTCVDPLTFVVVATHGEYEEPALAAALSTPAPYVGLVASRTRGEAVLACLAQQGLDAEALARVRFPAGLDIQARDGGEIAVSILAEIIQVRRALPEVGVAAASEDAIDPVCGMTVTVQDAKLTHDHDGRTYYFCGGGCRTRFAAGPDTYLSSTGV